MKISKLSDAELEVMQAIWKESTPVTTGMLLSQFSAVHDWKPQTLSTFLSRLVQKGMLAATKKGAGNAYTPIVSEKQYRKSQAKQFLEGEYDGSVKNFVAALYDAQGISREDIAELKNWLDQKSEG